MKTRLVLVDREWDRTVLLRILATVLDKQVEESNYWYGSTDLRAILQIGSED